MNLQSIFYFFLCCFFINPSLFSQACSCNIIEVETNTVEPCTITYGTTVTVSSVSEFKSAINEANNSTGGMTILIEDGTYQIASTSWYPYLTGDSIVIRSLSGNRNDVILTGSGMQSVDPGTEMGVFAVGNNIVIADLTIKEIGNHGIAVSGENLFVHNVRIQDTYEQMLKGVSANDGGDNGRVQCSLFEYSAGVGPQFYIGGLDVHDGDDWVVNDNIFKGIISPSGSVAEHAIHFWNNSSNNIIERNQIINCDRGIGFGLGSSMNDGGIIRNNMIYNDGTGEFSDVGIGLESSPNTQVYNNTIYVEHQNAIEYRFKITENVVITNNLCNKIIKSRDGGKADLLTNIEEVEENWFVDLSSGNLRLQEAVELVVDKGTELGSLVEKDIDKNERPQNAGYEIGAHEFFTPISSINLEEKKLINIHPNPAFDICEIDLGEESLAKIELFSSEGIKVKDEEFGSSIHKAIFYLDGLPTGIYWLKITTPEKLTYFSKLVISNR